MTPGLNVTERRYRQRAWVVVAVLVAVAGTLSTVIAARVVARSDAEKSQRQLEASSGDVASTLQLAIEREQDLALNASAFVLDHPQRLQRPLHGMDAQRPSLRAYPELESLGQVVIVPASELPAFAARVALRSTGVAAGRRKLFEVSPPGERPYYCLSALGLGRSALTAPPQGFDVCADPALDKAIRHGARHGAERLPAAAGLSRRPRWLGAQVPIYRGGVTPATVEGRRTTFVGVFGMLLNPTLVLDRALQGHCGHGGGFGFHDAYSDVVFREWHCSGRRAVGGDRPAQRVDGARPSAPSRRRRARERNMLWRC